MKKWTIIGIIILVALAVYFLSCTKQPAPVFTPKLVKAVEVIYPDTARVAGIEGVVYVKATIGTDGLVKSAVVDSSDNALLDAAAIEAVLQYEFTPPADTCVVTIPFKFKLSE